MARSSELPKINATYRVQLTKDYTLRDLAADVDYIHSLGVSHIYLSPILESASGSNHGYDATNPFEISKERGGEDALAELDWRLRKLKPSMGMILDIVPNHMAAIGENVLWYDVLKKGASSHYWKVFDIKVGRKEKIDLPVLGDTLAAILEREEIKIAHHPERGWEAHYYDKFFPVSKETEKRCHTSMSTHEVAAVLEAQHYRLVCWKEIFHKIDYRRFFDISGLIGVRMEDPAVFEMIHRKVLEIKNKYPSFTGVRVDHVDGMKFPGQYLKRLEQEIPLVWVEKILMPFEDLPPGWPVAGTTGYEFTAKLNELLVSKSGFKSIENFWHKETRLPWKNFQDCVHASKKEVLKRQFQPELARLSAHGETPEFWVEASAAMPVYRTYVSPGDYSEQDEVYINGVAERIGDDTVLARLTPRDPKNLDTLISWQQLTSPAMAKGLEDTAHYRYTPLCALNEVGCEVEIPESKGKKEFYDWMNDRNWRWPLSMNALSTHDTKRSADVRARLMALADIPEAWLDFVKQTKKKLKPAPSPSAGYLFLQTIVGAWPLDDEINASFIERIKNYMLKAAKEAKLETNWLTPDSDYEAALTQFVEESLANTEFLKISRQFMQRLAWLGALNSLTAISLQILSPGVPDIYQGNELWDLSLVDPDNRRPVDYNLRRKILKECQTAELQDLRSNWKNGSIKLWLTNILLEIKDNYLLPGHDIKIKELEVEGVHTDNLLAFDLTHINHPNRNLMVALATNAGSLPVDGNQQELHIPPQVWEGTIVDVPRRMNESKVKDLISGREFVCSGNKLSAAYIFQEFPIAVLSVL